MTKKTTIIALLAIILAAPTIFAADKPAPKPAEKPDFTIPELKFEEIEELYEGFLHENTQRVSGKIIHSSTSAVPEAKYIAKLFLDDRLKNRPISFSRTRGPSALARANRWQFANSNREMILKTPTGEKLSSKQKVFISSGHAILLPVKNQTPMSLYVLGVDKEQAKNTTIAFLEYLTESAEKNYRSAEKRVQEAEKQYQEQGKAAESYKEKIKAAEENFENQKRRTHYQNNEAASKAITRMNVIYEAKNIENRVLHAKRDAVEDGLKREENIKAGSSPDNYNRQPIVLKLEELRVDISIALAEIRATLEATSDIREKAERFIKYQNELITLNTAYNIAGDRLQKINMLLEHRKNIIAIPEKSLLPPNVIDNKITLQPIKAPDVDQPAKAPHDKHESH